MTINTPVILDALLSILYLLGLLSITWLPLISLIVTFINLIRFLFAGDKYISTSEEYLHRKRALIVWGIIFLVSSAASFCVFGLFADSIRFM